MPDQTTRYRNAIIRRLYAHVLKPIFFRFDPEAVHDRIAKVGIFLGRHAAGRALTHTVLGYEHPSLEQTLLGIHFKNPVGLSAGFDKNAELTDIMPSVGFGFAEVGSITGSACPGNPKPRLWRLPRSRSLVVYYGLKNQGCEAIAARLAGKHFAMPIGISVAMTNCAENLDITNAIRDFAKAFRVMEPHGAYITVNISCPNTSGGQPFILPENLSRLFDTLDTIPTKKPVFIKLSPDMTPAELDTLLDVVRRHRVHGIICANLTKNKEHPKIMDAWVPRVGGISGKVVQDVADALLSYVYQKEKGRFILLGVGGITTAEDAYKKIRLGASLVQMITGMIFEGPQIVSEINSGLARLLARDGFTHIHQAIGIDTCYTNK